MPRILFVDDEPAITKSLQRMVRSYAVEAETEAANSADEAYKRITQGDIDVLVSDVRMPGMDGIELLTRMKASPVMQHIPVIMLTGDGDVSIRNVALELGAVEFINKPADPTELCTRLRNVMRLKTYQDELVHQNEVLAAQIIQAQKMEIAGLLASQAAHDLRNVLSAIVGNTELVLYKTSDWGVHPQLQRVIQAAQHASRLVQQISDLGRRGTGETPSTNPCAVIDECLDLLRVLVPIGIKVDWTNPNLKVFTGVDKTALQQVVMNLIINAVHAINDSGSLSLQVATKEVASDEAATNSVPPGSFVVVSVNDNGCGIAPEVLPHIFEPFFTTKGIGQGTGLGLSVVNRIVRDQSGFVGVESAVGSGTTFSVHLPSLSVANAVTEGVAAEANR